MLMKTCFLIAMILPTPVLAQAPGAVFAGTRLEVTARGEVRRVPDIAIINAGAVTQAADAKTAMVQNAARMARAIGALRKAGVADRDITTAQVSLSPQYRYADNVPPVITGYQASNSVSVRFRDILKSGAILDALVAEGANQITGPTLTIERPEEAQDEARTAAVATARARAELYARAAGLKVRRIVAMVENADYSAPQPVMMAMAMRDASPVAKTEIVPGEQAVGVTLAVTFELQ